MNTFIILAAFLISMYGIFSPLIYTKIYSRRNNNYDSEIYNKLNKYKRRKGIIFILLGISLFIVGKSFKIVPTGYTGVRTTFGQVSDTVVQHGFNWKIPFCQDIKLVDNRQKDTVISTQVWGETKEKTPVYASEIHVTYKINAQKSAWIYANVANSDDLITSDIVSSAIKDAMVTLSVDNVTVRSAIEPLSKEKLIESVNEKYGEDTIQIMKIVINQMDFEDSYNQAISEKSIAQQNQARQEIENKTAIDKAEADKKVAITNAEAKAEATRIAAEAEANANKVLEESLTDNILKNRYYDVWDGHLPSVVGDSSVIIGLDTPANDNS